jgi:excisionase family DNA binding protein
VGKEELLKELSATMQSLSVEEFAQSIDKPKWKVYRMVKNGEAPKHFTIGKEIRFSAKAIKAWWSERE